MADTDTNPLDRLSSFFFAKDASDPRVNPQIRQRIAMQMLASGSKKGYPKNLGEGLTAIGDAIGDRGMMSQIEAADLAAQKAAAAQAPPPDALPTAAPQITSSDLPVVPQTTAAVPQTTATVPQTTAQTPEQAMAAKLIDYGQNREEADRATFPQIMPRAGQPYDPVAGNALPGGRTTVPVTPGPQSALPARDRLASLLATRALSAQGVPQPNPTLAGPGGPQPDDRRLIMQAAPGASDIRVTTPADQIAMRSMPGAATDIRRAPQPPQIQSAPRVAQAGPDADYVTAMPPDVVPPRLTPPHPLELQGQAAIVANPGNDYVRQRWEPIMAAKAAERTARDRQLEEQYKADVTQRNTLIGKREDMLKDRAERMQKATKAADEARLSQQFGGLPTTQVFEEMNKSKDEAIKARNGLIAANEARKAINAGAITGYGAESKLDLAKLIVSLGGKDTGDRIKNTEVFRAAIAPIVAGMRAATTGSGNFSDADREFLVNAAGGKITLDGDSIRRVMDLVERGSRLTLEGHQAKMDALFPNSPQGKALFGVDAPQIEKGAPLTPVRVSSPDEARRLASGTRIILPDGRIGTVP